MGWVLIIGGDRGEREVGGGEGGEEVGGGEGAKRPSFLFHS